MTETMICQYCGATIPADAETCFMCGAPTTPPPPPTFTPAPTAPTPEVAEAAVNQSTPPNEPPQAEIFTPEPVNPLPEKYNTTPNRGLAVVVEIAAGIFGFLGIGWMIAGKLITGIILLVGYWLLLLGYFFLLFSWISKTDNWVLLSLCCLLPIFPLASGLILHLRTK